VKYMHFTSPIRRYPDLMVHQAITAYEQGQVLRRDFPVSSAAESCSALERRADAAERSATELMALLYLSTRTGEVFRGVVRDSVDFGLFVRLLDVPVEGLLHVSALLENRHLIGAGLQPGSPVTVSVEKADPLQRKLSLVPAEPAEEDDHD
jgi:ribonuclease R